ncbi:MAG: hypothetical protein WA919_22975 [Coleofasciculaceae cyanobacterium]
MASIPQRQSNLDIHSMVEQILSTGQLNRQEYLQMTTAILSDYNVSDEERCLINRIFDETQIGRVKIVD